MKCTGDVLYSDVGLSFWGGIDPSNGMIIDQTHPLYGKCVTDKILCIPSGRGSCTGSQVMLELILNNVAPKAIQLRDADAILCTGCIVADEFFQDEVKMNVNGLPSMIKIEEEDFAMLSKVHSLSINVNINTIDLAYDYDDGTCNPSRVVIHPGLVEKGCMNTSTCMFGVDLLHLDAAHHQMLDNMMKDDHDTNKAKILALRTVLRVAAISSSVPVEPELIPIKSAHIDSVTYIGSGGLQFVQKLVALGGKVSVPTTLNSQSVDRRRWNNLGVDEELAQNANSVGDAYLQLGCDMSFTCAPYLLPTRPAFGDQIMWGESNAVVYSNSVIGARTEKYADYFDICAAIVGKVPKMGVHLDQNRKATKVIEATDVVKVIMRKVIDDKERHGGETDLESLFPLMGWTVGNLSDGKVPVILGMDQLPMTDDNLKAFCAAYGTTGTSPLFHMAHVTPEAMDKTTVKEIVKSCKREGNVVHVSMEDLYKGFTMLDGSTFGDDDTNPDTDPDKRVDLIALGNPHLSLNELKRLSELLEADRMELKIKTIATLSRHVQAEGSELGYTKKLEEFGVTLVNDTCWCMMLDPPIIPVDPAARIMTNSGKYAHYGPGLTNRKLRFGTMMECVEAAKMGEKRSSSIPSWLVRRFLSTTRRIK